jgi:hypothetical protein
MKYLKSYNESLRDLMVPKSDDKILNSLKKLSNLDILRKSFKYDFIKGVELALQNELTTDDINYIIANIFYIENKEIIRLLYNKIKYNLNKDQIYIIEKYIFGLHQDEEKSYERWFKEQLTNLYISKSKQHNDILIYKKDDDVLFNYNEKNGWFYIDFNKIWSVFQSKYHLNYNEIKILTKDIVEEQLNLKVIITIEYISFLY